MYNLEGDELLEEPEYICRSRGWQWQSGERKLAIERWIISIATKYTRLHIYSSSTVNATLHKTTSAFCKRAMAKKRSMWNCCHVGASHYLFKGCCLLLKNSTENLTLLNWNHGSNMTKLVLTSVQRAKVSKKLKLEFQKCFRFHLE